MTLTLEEVRNTKFHVARRQGYDTTEVDLFVDKVEAAFGQIVEENQTMRSQLEALKEAQPEAGAATAEAGGDGAAAESADLEQVRAEARKEAEAEFEKKLAEVKNQHAAELKAARDEAARAKEAASQNRSAAPAATPSAAPSSALPDGVKTDEQGRVVVTTGAEAGAWVERVIEDANRIAAEADAEAKSTVENAKRQAQQITDEAKGRAHRVEQDARTNAEQITTQAQGKAADLNRELDAKRVEMMSKLEGERDTLSASVSRLRAFEGRYRQNLTKHLQDQIRSLEAGGLEPADEGSEAPTPRLDALAGGHSEGQQNG